VSLRIMISWLIFLCKTSNVKHTVDARKEKNTITISATYIPMHILIHVHHNFFFPFLLALQSLLWWESKKKRKKMSFVLFARFFLLLFFLFFFHVHSSIRLYQITISFVYLFFSEGTCVHEYVYIYSIIYMVVILL